MGIIPCTSGLLGLTLIHAITNSAFGLMGACGMSVLNNATQSRQRATVNGISVTCESLMKGIAPMVSSVSFAGSLSAYGAGGRFVVFFSLAGIHVLLAVAAFLLPATVISSRGVDKVKQTPSASGSSPVPLTIGEASDRLDDAAPSPRQ